MRSHSKVSLPLGPRRILGLFLLLLVTTVPVSQANSESSDTIDPDQAKATVVSTSPLSCAVSRLRPFYGAFQNTTSRYILDLPDLWNNCTSRYFPQLWESMKSAMANQSSNAMALVTTGPSAAVLLLLGYNGYVATTRRRLFPQYRTLQLLSAIAAVENANEKTSTLLTRLFLIGTTGKKRSSPALVPISLKGDNHILVPLWNGTLAKNMVGIKDGWYATHSNKKGSKFKKQQHTLDLYIDVDGKSVAVYTAAIGDDEKLLEEWKDTDWVQFIDNLVPDYGKSRGGQEEKTVAVESTVTKWAWQQWLKYKLLKGTSDTDDEDNDKDQSIDSFVSPGRYTFLYREAVDEEEFGVMMRRRGAALLSKFKTTKPPILVVEEPEKVAKENTTTSSTDDNPCYRQRCYMESFGRTWFLGILPFQARSCGWIVPQTTTQIDNNNNQEYQGYSLSLRPILLPPSKPPELQIEWESSSISLGFPKRGMGWVTEINRFTKNLKEAPWPIKKRNIEAEGGGEEKTARVLLMSRPRQGWLVWRHKV